MKKILTILAISIGISSFAQVKEESPATDSIMVQDTIEPAKMKLSDKVGKLFGWDKEEEIQKLSIRIKTQKIAIDSMSAALSSKQPFILKTVKIPSISEEDSKSIKKDELFVKGLPKSYSSLSKKDVSNIAREIDRKIADLIRQRDSLVKSKSSKEVIAAKETLISELDREKKVIGLSGEREELKGQNEALEIEKKSLSERQAALKKYLVTAIIALLILALAVAILLQRRRIKSQDTEIEKQIDDINKKNTYLEYAARIIRHDMHSGINTYMPRGLSSLKKRILPDVAESMKIAAPMKMIEEGLAHTQKVYKNVYEFTNLVKSHSALAKESIDIKEALERHLATTSYSSQVSISDLGKIEANELLFCGAIDNLIKNGLKYNKSDIKEVRMYISGEYIVVEDNGTGLSSKKFEKILKKGIGSESETGIGICIANAIIEEHGFSMECEGSDKGTKIKIRTA